MSSVWILTLHLGQSVCRVWCQTLEGLYRGAVTTNDNPRPLSVILGERLREFREERSLRQSDVASAAAGIGLGWARSSVAALESGSRKLSFEEVALLPTLVGVLGGWDKPLLRDDDISLTDDRHVKPRALMLFVNGLTRPKGPVGEAPATPAVKSGSRETKRTPLGGLPDLEIARPAAVEGAWLLIGERLYPDNDPREVWASGNIDRELISRLTSRVKFPDPTRVTWVTLPVFSMGLWGKPFGNERDDRVAGGTYPTTRSRQSARGHATRDMIGELDLEVQRRWPVVEEVFARLDDVWDSRWELDKFRGEAFRWAIPPQPEFDQRVQEADALLAKSPQAQALMDSIREQVEQSREELGLTVEALYEATGESINRIGSLVEGTWFLKTSDPSRAYPTLAAVEEVLKLRFGTLIDEHVKAWELMHGSTDD